MTVNARALPLLLLVLVGGCARLALMGSEDPLADMKAAQQAGDFQRALYFAEHLESDHPQYEAMQKALPSLRSAIREFELRSIRRAEAAAAREEWDTAYEILEQAMANWRASEPLLDAHRKIRAAEDHRRREIHGNLLLSEARWRIEQDSKAAQLQYLTDHHSRRRFSEWQQRNRQVADSLAELADYFSGEGDWDRVQDYLASARALVPDSGRKELLDKARQELAAAAREYRMARHRQQLSEARSLLERYQSTSQLHDLLAVRKFLRRHEDNDALADMKEKVRQLTEKRFREDMERGEALYARGQYQEAYQVWKGIAPLAPENLELRKKLERAEKVLSKLKSLSGD